MSPLETNVDRSSPPLAYQTAYQLELHARHHDRRRDLIRSLYATAEADEPLAQDQIHPARKLGNQIASCGSHPHILQNEVTGQLWISPGRCGQRACPLCGQTRARQLEGRVRAHLAAVDSARFLTLTTRATSAPLAQRLADLLAAFRRLRQRASWKRHVKGGVAVVEITYNRKTDQWHPHLHAIIDGVYWPKAEISAEWAAVTGGSTIVDIQLVSSRDGVSRYLSKYVGKSNAPLNAPDRRLAEWCLAIKGGRQLQTFGSLHGRKAAAAEKEDPAPMQRLIHLGLLAEEGFRGDRHAARLYRLAQQAAAAGVDPDPSAHPRASLARHRRIAAAIRRWMNPPTPATRPPPPPRSDPQQRLWSWTDPPTRLAAGA